jgi:hypothetical protein
VAANLDERKGGPGPWHRGLDMCDRCAPQPLSRRTVLASAVVGAVATAFRPLPSAVAVAAVQPVPGLEVFPRTAWGEGMPTKGPLAREDDVRFLLVHHTASDTSHRQADVPGLLRSYYRLHTSGARSWNDIAYNFLVDREGGVWEGRAGSLAGAVRGDATGGNQGFDQLVCLIGDFTSVMPSAAALAALEKVLAWLADRHHVETAAGSTATFVSRGSNRWPAGQEVTVPTISGHRQLSVTGCPGDTFFPYVRDRLTDRVRSVRVARVPPPTTVTTVAPTTTTPPTTEPATAAPTATTAGTVVESGAPAARPARPGASPSRGPVIVGGAAGGALVGVTAIALAMRRRSALRRSVADDPVDPP